jgi:hypothetical protein
VFSNHKEAAKHKMEKVLAAQSLDESAEFTAAGTAQEAASDSTVKLRSRSRLGGSIDQKSER